MRRLFFGILLLLGASAGWAQTPAVTAISGGSSFGSLDGTDMTVGWTFTPTVNVTVSSLGVWDDNTSTPLAQTHQVGLWNSAGTLLASTTIQTASPATGSWRYVAITPVVLTAGQTYYIGSAVTDPYTDVYSRVPAAGGSVTTNGLITIGTSTTNASSGGFSFPSTPNATYLGRFGPNLIVAAGPATVPVSSAAIGAAALALAMAGFLLLRPRRAQTL